MISSLRGTQPGQAQRLARLFFLAPFFLMPLFLPLAVALADGTTAARAPDEWLRLLHYSGPKTNDSGPRFFITQNGESDPNTEFQASVAELRKSGSDFECRFPARAMLLRRIFPGIKNQIPACLEWDAFRERIAAVGASVVFSSYYLNNPSSAFGHSFLRIHRDPKGDFKKSAELLDTGVGYAATVTTQNAILYALYGLTGGFRGDYTALPYYYKVREYAEAENRDLWSYQLNLSKEELALLVAHLFELDRTDRRYYYMTRNCSYEILAIIEAVLAPTRKNPHLLQRMPWIVIPAHTLQALFDEPGLINSVDYRASQRKILEARLSNLTAEEVRIAHDWEKIPSKPELGVRVLDARIDWIDFEMFQQLVKEDPAASTVKHAALTARAQTGVQMQNLLQIEPSGADPASSHPPRRLTLGTRDLKAVELEWRLALHDLLDPSQGFPETSTLEFARIKVRAERTSSDGKLSFHLGDATVFQAQSLVPWSVVKLDPSWRVRLRLEGDATPHFEAGGGFTIAPISNVHIYAIAGADLRYSRQSWAGIWGEIGLHGRIRQRLAWLLTLNQDRTLELGLRSRLASNWALGGAVTTETQTRNQTWQAGVSYYY